MTRPRSPTLTQRKYFSYAIEAHKHIEEDFQMPDIPKEWHDVWKLRAENPDEREEITLKVNKQVIRFFKAMGEGSDARMNRVLVAFMYSRLAGIVAGPEERALPEAEKKLSALETELLELRAQSEAEDPAKD